MNVFGKIRDIFKRDLSLSNPKAWDRSLWNLTGSQSLSGETVTESTALTYSAVFNAITLYSGTIGSLPLHLMQKKNRTTTQATENSLYRVMHTQYNPYMAAMTGRECMIAHILAWGNGYAEIVRNVLGDIVELWPIPPNRVTPKMLNGKLVYEIKMDGEADIIMPREKILHIPGLGFDGFIGYSVIAMARKSIGLGMAMETFGSLYFGNGTHPGVVVSHPATLSEQASNNLKSSLAAAHSGLGQSHRLLLLEEAMKIEKVGISPEESQFLESRAWQVTDIARWFNLPVHKLKEMTKSSFNNIESEQMSYVSDSILPWLIRLEQNFLMQLLTPTEIKKGFYFKHIVEGLLRANAKDRAEFYSKMWQNGLMTQNEIRDKEDLNPDSSPFADELFVPLNTVPLSLLEEHLKAQNKEPEPINSANPTDPIPQGKGNGEDKEAPKVPAIQ